MANGHGHHHHHHRRRLRIKRIWRIVKGPAFEFRAVKVCTGFGSEMGDKGREGEGRKEGRKEGGRGLKGWRII